MQKDILDALYKPFDLKARPGQGGQTFRYVPSDDVVDRMNQVFRGNWSTEVMEREVIEDQILIRVRVVVKDPMDQDSMVYWQEGYASQAIARFNQGVKSGQIIDLGNSYKSAMSKAIKTAVARWGVGLYLETTSVNEEVGTDSFDTPNIPTDTPQPKVVESIKSEQPFPPFSAPVNNTGSAIPVAEPVNVPPMMFDSYTEAPRPNVVDDPLGGMPGSTPVFTDDNVIVTKPNTSTNFNPPIDSVIKQGAGGVENLTDVQKAAIDNIMSVHGKTFVELASAALQKTTDLPAAVEALTYQDAVKLIQYGNNLNTNS